MKDTLSFLLHIVLIISFMGSCSKHEPVSQTVESTDYQKAEAFLNTQNDSAFYYFNKVATTSKQPLEVAMAYNQMAVIQSDAGDYFGSQESLSISLKYLDPKKPDDHPCLASDYNELGTTSTKLKHYHSAAGYFDQALKYTADSNFRVSILNNKALSYQKDKKFDQALKIYGDALAQVSRKKTYARILTNIATTKWLANDSYNPVHDFRKALEIRINEKDRWGQNSSFGHLADYYIDHKPDSALFYAKTMLAIATELESPDDRLEALDKLVRLSERTADAKGYFLRYTKLSDSVATARNAAKNQFALIRYETEKSKADNLNLQKENAEKKYQIIRQQYLLWGSLAFLIALSVIASIWYKKRKQKLALETEASIRDNQLKLSKKVHDVVANGLYRVMSEIENQEDLDKDGLLDRIEGLYEKSRDISYEDSPVAEPDFKEKVNGLLLSFGSQTTRVSLVGNEEGLWQQVNLKAKQEIAHVLQELMVNMKKHSGAENVVLKFEKMENCINIHYTDDGIGINGEIKFNNGLTSTGNRMDSIGGSITFDTKSDRGLNIDISFPIT